MKPGPELDALVEVHIFGKRLDTSKEYSGMVWDDSSKFPHCNIPRPLSTDISIAWEVVEKMREEGFGFGLWDQSNGWECLIGEFPMGTTVLTAYDTAQEAIVKAALCVKGVEV